MRHGMVNRKLGRTSSHRLAMFRNQLASLIQAERIVTTLPKAKELRPQIERLVTLGRDDSVHNRRQAARLIGDDTLVAKLFDILGPRFSDRPGGYTRIVKLGPRRGDAAERAILEFVDFQLPSEKKPAAGAEAKTSSKKPAKKESKAENEEAPAAEETPKKTSSKKAAPKKAAPKAAAPKKKAAPAAEEKPKRPRKKTEDK